MAILKLISFAKRTPILQCRLFSDFTLEHLNRNIPRNPVKSPKPISIKIDDETIRHLERLSLVDFANEEGIRRLEDAIGFAKPIQEVNTKDVEPMYSVLDSETLRLREDEVTEGNCRDAILSNAAKVEEDYFLAPPGNIPLNVQKSKYRQTDE